MIRRDWRLCIKCRNRTRTLRGRGGTRIGVFLALGRSIGIFSSRELLVLRLLAASRITSYTKQYVCSKRQYKLGYHTTLCLKPFISDSCQNMSILIDYSAEPLPLVLLCGTGVSATITMSARRCAHSDPLRAARSVGSV